jgi:hypothetical protein
LTFRLFCFAMALSGCSSQQTCLLLRQWACYDLRGTLLANVRPAGAPEERPRDLRRFVLQQIGLLAALIALAAADLWILPPVHPHLNNSPSPVWQFLCTVMLILDGGLVSFEWRIYRLHAVRDADPGAAGARFAFWWTTGCLILYALWFGGALSVTRRYGLNPLEWEFLCLFYFRIVNGLYLALEGRHGRDRACCCGATCGGRGTACPGLSRSTFGCARWEGIRGLLGTFEGVTNMMCSARHHVHLLLSSDRGLARKEEGALRSARATESFWPSWS